MNYKNILAVTLLVAVVGVFSLLQQRPWEALAGTFMGQGMTSTSTTYLANNTVLCSNGGVLGSIVGHGAHSGYLWVIDASSTTHTNFSTTSALIAEMPTGYASTSVEYGVQANRGLIVNYTGTGSTTITYRCGA